MKTLRALGILCVVCCVIAVALAIGKAKAAEQNEVPLGVLKAALEACGITIGEVKVEQEDGRVIYEIELLIGDREAEVEVTAEGEVLEFDEEMPVAAVPEAVMVAAQKAVPDGTPTEAEKQIENGTVLYEIEFNTADGEVEVRVSEDGQVVKVQQEGEEEQHEEEHHD